MYQIPPAIFYLYKYQIRPKLEYSRHICTGAISSHSLVFISFKQVYAALLVINYFTSKTCFRQTKLYKPLFYRDFHGMCSAALHSLMLPYQTITNCTHLAKDKGVNHHHFLRILLVTSKFHSGRLFQRTSALEN